MDRANATRGGKERERGEVSKRTMAIYCRGVVGECVYA